MFKKIIVAVAMLALALAGAASAGAPTAVIDSTGASVYGTFGALSIEKDRTSGNRVKIKYVSGYKYVNDDGAWSRYALFTTGLFKPVASPNGEYTVDAAKATVSCSNGQTYLSWTDLPSPEYVNDGCALFNSVKAASQ